MSLRRPFSSIFKPCRGHGVSTQPYFSAVWKRDRFYGTTSASTSLEEDNMDGLTTGKAPVTGKAKAGRKSKKPKLKPDPVEEASEEKVFFKLNPAAREIVEYMDQKNKKKGLWQSLPKKYLRQLRDVPKSATFIEEDEAVRFADALESENLDLSNPVLEINAGIGLLTSQLVHKLKFECVSCTVDDPGLAKLLKARLPVNQVLELTTDSIPRYACQDKIDGGDRVHNLMQQIGRPKNPTAEGKVQQQQQQQLYLIGAIMDIGFVNFLLRSFASQTAFFDNEVPWSSITMFVAFGGRVNFICSAKPADNLLAYRATTVLFRTFFTMKEIAVIPRKAFAPWETGEDEDEKLPYAKRRRLTPKDSDIVHVFRVEVNEENVKKIGRQHIFNYFYFVREHLFSRKNRVIPQLEKWIPGCGTRLIRQGFDIFTQMGELSPEEIRDLFAQFVAWPEFANSSFLSAVEKYQTRVDLPEEDDSLESAPVQNTKRKK